MDINMNNVVGPAVIGGGAVLLFSGLGWLWQLLNYLNRKLFITDMPVRNSAAGTITERGMAARLGIFLNAIFTVIALIVAGLTVVLTLNYPPSVLVIAVGFALAAAIWAFGRGLRFVLTGPDKPSLS